LHIIVYENIDGETMKRNAILLSDDANFVFMMTTIIDQMELNLLKVEKKDDIWQQITEKEPSIVIWDFGNSNHIDGFYSKLQNNISHNCHFLVFSDSISGLSHFSNGRIHIFQKPFSPNEVSHLIREITN